MRQEEDKIREGLIALLCVGDPILHLSTNMHTYASLAQKIRPLNIIAKYKIAEIKNGPRIRIRTSTAEFDQNLDNVHQHEGVLYICNTLNWYNEDEYEKHLKQLADILKSEYTIYVK